MHNELTKAEVLDTLRAERSRWDALLAAVGDARMTQRVPGSLWSPKDIMAHIAWYEQETAAVLEAGNDPHARRDWLWAIPEYQRNAILYREHRERPLGEVRATAQEAYAPLVAAVVALAEENGRDPQRFPHLPAGWTPWKVIAVHSYEHYRQYIPSIRAWLDLTAPESDSTLWRALTAGALQAREDVAPAPRGPELEVNITRWEEEGGRV
jgi:hypothetical protein